MNATQRLLGWIATLTIALFLTACWPMGHGHMGPGGMMGRGHNGMMGPGMMGRSAPPPVVTPAPTATPGGMATVSYRRDVQPIFDGSCVRCHGGQGGLYLDSYDHVMAGGAHGPVVVPGDPEASELLRRIRGLSQPQMPLGAPPLSPAAIDTIATWIAEGAPNN